MKTLLLIFCSFLCILFGPLTTFGEVKTFVHSVRQPFSGSQSPDDARIAATHKAKREVLERAGTYLETLTIVEKGKLSKDHILALASAVLETEIISHKNYHTEESFGIDIKVRVKVDTRILNDRISKLLSNRDSMRQLLALRKREKELLDKIERLERENQSLFSQEETKTVKKKKIVLQNDFKETSTKLTAVDFNDEALALVRNGNSVKAISVLDRAINLDPGYAQSYLLRAIIFYHLKKIKEALKDSDKAIELEPEMTQVVILADLIGLPDDDRKRKIERIDKLIAFDPTLSWAYNMRGVQYRNLKKYSKALADFKQAIELDPNDPQFYYERGTAYQYIKEDGKAIQDFTKAIMLNPSYAAAYLNRGYVFFMQNKNELVIRDLSEAIELDPNNSNAFHLRGLAYKNLNQTNKAILDFDRTIELNPNNAKAYLARGIAYFESDKYVEAARDIDKAIGLGLKSAKAYGYRGISFGATGRFQEACTDLKTACELDNELRLGFKKIMEDWCD